MNYVKAAQKAKNSLSKNGSECCLIRKSDEVYDAITNEYVSTETQILGYGIVNSYDIKYVNGTTIQAGDVNIMCYLDEAPKMSDTIKVGNQEYKVVNVAPFCPDGTTVIYYTVQGR